MENCNRRLLKRFLTDKLDVDDQLRFLAHVEECTECWDEVYNSVKAQHPHYYKSTGRRVKISDKEIRQFEKMEKPITEVA
ncbi:MAG: hypothetical protein IIB03_05245 [Acidobacteria bacterium]|nr:hypothetical protein [Acidobacteriota bacterium]